MIVWNLVSRGEAVRQKLCLTCAASLTSEQHTIHHNTHRNALADCCRISLAIQPTGMAFAELDSRWYSPELSFRRSSVNTSMGHLLRTFRLDFRRWYPRHANSRSSEKGSSAAPWRVPDLNGPHIAASVLPESTPGAGSMVSHLSSAIRMSSNPLENFYRTFQIRLRGRSR